MPINAAGQHNIYNYNKERLTTRFGLNTNFCDIHFIGMDQDEVCLFCDIDQDVDFTIKAELYQVNPQ